MNGNPTESRPWDRLQNESAQAYAAFKTFRDLGDRRTFIGCARALGKADSLIRGWAVRHDWRSRVHAWELVQSRQDEAAIRQERDEAVRRQLRDADRMQQVCMAKLRELVHRDPATGEASLDPSLSPRDAVDFYTLSLKIRRSLAPAASADSPVQAAGSDLPSFPDPELEELIRLCRERAGQQPTTPQSPHKEVPQDEKPSRQ